MLKKLSRFVLLSVLAAGLLVSVAPLWTPGTSAAGFCAAVCDDPGPCPHQGLVPVKWVGPGCTGLEPRCYPVCIGPGA